MSTNLQRAARASHCVEHYRSLAGPGLGRGEAVTDLVADLGHLCVENDLAYLHLLALGVSHWHLEMTDADSTGPLPEVSVHINESTNP